MLYTKIDCKSIDNLKQQLRDNCTDTTDIYRGNNKNMVFINKIHAKQPLGCFTL